MNAALGMAEERTFEVDTERTSARAIAGGCIGNGTAQRIKRTQSFVDRSGHSGGAVASDTMLRHEALDGGEARVRALHHVMTGAAVNVDVDQSGGEHRIAEIDDASVGRNANLTAVANGGNRAVFDEQDRVIDDLQRSAQPLCEKSCGQFGSS